MEVVTTENKSKIAVAITFLFVMPSMVAFNPLRLLANTIFKEASSSVFGGFGAFGAGGVTGAAEGVFASSE